MIAGIMEHIEEAGVHSGDSACVLPPTSLAAASLAEFEAYTARLARALHVIGLMNVQYAVKDGTVYVLEVNPRATRTVPFVTKATGVPLPSGGGPDARQMKICGAHGRRRAAAGAAVSCEIAGLPVQQFPGVDPALGPEMRSTGEVMGVGESFGEAFAKAQLAAGTRYRTKAHCSSASTTATRPRPSRWRPNLYHTGSTYCHAGRPWCLKLPVCT